MNFNFTVFLVKTYYDRHLSIYPLVQRNLSLDELENLLNIYLTDLLSKELMERVKFIVNSPSKDIDKYIGGKKPYRQLTEELKGSLININIFVD